MTTEHHRHTHHLDPQQLAAIIDAIRPPDPEPIEPATCGHPAPEPASDEYGNAIFLDDRKRFRLITPTEAADAPASWQRLYTR